MQTSILLLLIWDQDKCDSCTTIDLHLIKRITDLEALEIKLKLLFHACSSIGDSK